MDVMEYQSANPIRIDQKSDGDPTATGAHAKLMLEFDEHDGVIQIFNEDECELSTTSSRIVRALSPTTETTTQPLIPETTTSPFAITTTSPSTTETTFSTNEPTMQCSKS